MGAPVSDIKAAESASAESLLESFKSIDAGERRRHASVLNYWLSIRGDKDVAPIRDLDPLEISDAGPDSLLLELIGGGEDAEIKHSGDALKAHADVFRLSEAARPSLLSCIAGKLAIVAISRNFLAFEDSFATSEGTSRCWITLLPFSSTGVWVDYVYAFATVADVAEAAEADAAVEEAAEANDVAPPAEVTEEEAVVADEAPEPVEEIFEEPVEDVIDAPIENFVEPAAEEIEPPVEEIAEVESDEPLAEEPEAVVEPEAVPEAVIEPEAEIEAAADYEEPTEQVSDKKPGFSKIFEALTGFHGTSVRAEPKLPAEPIIEDEPAAFEEEAPLELDAQFEPAPEPEVEAIAELEPEPEIAAAEPVANPEPTSVEGPLQTKLEEVRAKADEARLAKLRSNIALYEGLGAAYDFALDAEHAPEEYLRLVEAKGLKIQLRSPMTPVVKLAFEGMCDDSMIGQLEAVLAWALKQDLPRGTLAERIEAAGGIAPLLNGNKGEQAEAA